MREAIFEKIFEDAQTVVAAAANTAVLIWLCVCAREYVGTLALLPSVFVKMYEPLENDVKNSL